MLDLYSSLFKVTHYMFCLLVAVDYIFRDRESEARESEDAIERETTLRVGVGL
ncbi:hypothetical protein Hdeb2414_s0003g00088831 [Helianthus debilis subsp. tardiflorus]